jgi:hypothetical protein
MKRVHFFGVVLILAVAFSAIAFTPGLADNPAPAQTSDVTLPENAASPDAAPAAPATTSFATGSLIIPMDTDATGNHASYNQNSGMWKAYGLLYRLLQNDIPVHWAIKNPNKIYNDVDFTVTSVSDKRTSTALGQWDYRGGPFIIDSAYAAAASPIIATWWAANSNLPNVHVAGASFTADVNIILRHAPIIANEEINGSISFAYYNAAGIPDLNGNTWSSSSPNVLGETEIANGGLFQTGICLQRKFDTFVTPHNTGYDISLTDPTNLGTRTYSQLDTFVHQGGGWTALCHSLSSNDTNIANLTLNGNAAVKAMFKTSLPGGKPGGFLTQTGFPFDPAAPFDAGPGAPNVGGVWTVNPASAGLPVAQAVPNTQTQALPGGSVQTWPTSGSGVPKAPTYWPNQTELVAYFANTPNNDHILNGVYHDGTGFGKLTYIGGHSFAVSTPYSTNMEAPYLRMFYNSLFFNGNAVAKLDVVYNPPKFVQYLTPVLDVSLKNTGASTAINPQGVTITLEPGFTYATTTFGPLPVVTVVSGKTVLTWDSSLGNALGDVPGDAIAVTVQLNVGSSISSTTGFKSFGTIHSQYGDVFGEAFTVDVCRDIEVVNIPDRGDLPDTYKTLIASDGPSHAYIAGNPTLGAYFDYDEDGKPTVDARGDDNVGIPDDEDGVLITNLYPFGGGAGPGNARVTVSNNPGCLNAWMDFSNNAALTPDGNFTVSPGVYDAYAGFSEQILINRPVNVGLNNVPFFVPPGLLGNSLKQYYVRFRLTPQVAGACPAVAIAPTGAQTGGEVEDYRFSFSPLAVTLDSFTATASSTGVSVAWVTVSDLNISGFNLYRAESESEAVVGGTQLNTELIPASGSTEGHEYAWLDTTALPGHTYWYRLDVVSPGGAVTSQPPVMVGAPTSVRLVGLGASPALGTAMPLAAIGFALLTGFALARRQRR